MAKHQWALKGGETVQGSIARCRVCGLRRKLAVQVVLRDRAKLCRSARFSFALYAVPRGRVWSTFQPGCNSPSSVRGEGK
jgi:hypothetical protein